jgi:hypothetical protein
MFFENDSESGMFKIKTKVQIGDGDGGGEND